MAPTVKQERSPSPSLTPHEPPSISASPPKTTGKRKFIASGSPHSESESDLSRDDLIKLVVEKEELLKLKQKEMEKMQDKVLRTYAEMENVMDRTRREAENSKKFAVQVLFPFFIF